MTEQEQRVSALIAHLRAVFPGEPFVVLPNYLVGEAVVHWMNPETVGAARAVALAWAGETAT